MSGGAALRQSRAAVIAEQVRDAQLARRSLRIVGAGTWLESGAPVDASADVSCAAHREVVEYVPGDLTMTVGAGTPLSTIERTAAANDQWLTLDPFGSPDGTIGATVATASAGPLATAFGTPRDLVLGIEAVTGTGNVIRAGGRVVKNVAGFDLVRLFTGSRGTLGVITEVSLRLRARPARDETVAIAVEDRRNGLRAIVRALREWPFTPMAAEIIGPACASAVGLPAATTLLLRFGGNARAVASQRKRAASLGRGVAIDPAVWTRLRAVEEGAAAVIRLSDLPSAFAERWDDAETMSGSGGFVIGSPARGTLRCVLRNADKTRITAFRARAGTAAVLFESLPNASLWNALTVEIEPTSLNGRVRAAFDPAGILNPGIMRLAR
jgi:glycolate oxidase FAD binding subunit